MVRSVTVEERQLLLGVPGVSTARRTFNEALNSQFNSDSTVAGLYLETDGDLAIVIVNQDANSEKPRRRTIVIKKAVVDAFLNQVDPDTDLNNDVGIFSLIKFDILQKYPQVTGGVSDSVVVEYITGVEVDQYDGQLITTYTLNDNGKVETVQKTITRQHLLFKALEAFPAQIREMVTLNLQRSNDKDSMMFMAAPPVFTTNPQDIIDTAYGILNRSLGELPPPSVVIEKSQLRISGSVEVGQVVNVGINTDNLQIYGGMNLSILSNRSLAYSNTVLEDVGFTLTPNDEDPNVLVINLTGQTAGKRLMVSGATADTSGYTVALRYNQNYVYLPNDLNVSLDKIYLNLSVVDETAGQYGQLRARSSEILYPVTVAEPAPAPAEPESTPQPETTAPVSTEHERLLLNLIYQGQWWIGEDSNQQPLIQTMYLWDSEVPEYVIHPYLSDVTAQVSVVTPNGEQVAINFNEAGTTFTLQFPTVGRNGLRVELHVQASRNGVAGPLFVIPVSLQHGP